MAESGLGGGEWPWWRVGWAAWRWLPCPGGEGGGAAARRRLSRPRRTPLADSTSRLHLGCISAASRLHLGCISAASRLRLGCICAPEKRRLALPDSSVHVRVRRLQMGRGAVDSRPSAPAHVPSRWGGPGRGATRAGRSAARRRRSVRPAAAEEATPSAGTASPQPRLRRLRLRRLCRRRSRRRPRRRRRRALPVCCRKATPAEAACRQWRGEGG